MDIVETGWNSTTNCTKPPKMANSCWVFGPRGAGLCLSGALFIHIRDKIINTIQVLSHFDYGSWLLAALQFVLQWHVPIHSLSVAFSRTSDVICTDVRTDPLYQLFILRDKETVWLALIRRKIFQVKSVSLKTVVTNLLLLPQSLILTQFLTLCHGVTNHQFSRRRSSHDGVENKGDAWWLEFRRVITEWGIRVFTEQRKDWLLG